MKIYGKLKVLDKLNNGNIKESEKKMSSIDTNFIDDMIFQETLEDYNKLKDKVETMEEEPFFKKFNSDLFNALYKISPELYDKEDVTEALKMENDIVREAINNDKFNELRKFTSDDTFNSVCSMKAFQDKAYKIVEEWKKESEENEEIWNSMNEAIQEQDQLQSLLQDLEDNPNNQSIQDAIDYLKNSIDQKNNNMKNQNNSNNGNPMNGLSQKIQESLSDAFEEAKENADALKNFGVAGQGSEEKVKATFGEKKELTDALKNNRKLKEVSKVLGRIKEKLSDVSKKPSKYGAVISDIGLGSNLKKTLNSEKVKLVEPGLENDFFKKMLENNLLEYKTNGFEHHKGPVVMCLDNSGSMEGRNDIWAKAVASALLQIAKKEKRHYRVILFDDCVDEIFDFDPDDRSLENLFDLINYRPSGGTQFGPALEEALESIEESNYKKADILFITDGDSWRTLEDDLMKRINHAKENKELAIQSIKIGNDSCGVGRLEQFSDSIICLSDLNEDNELVNAINNIQRH